MIIGVDEAGRGCIIGPMVICAAVINPFDEYKLKELGVKDSKKLTPSKRQKLYGKIGKICRYTTIKVSAQEINELMKSMNLNEIEAMKIAHAIDQLNITNATIFVDSPDPIPSKFAARIKKYLKKSNHIIAENKADDKYLIVGAASIIAKVTRDREIEKIKKATGIEFNSGYTSDPITQYYVKKRAEYPQLEPYLRIYWATLKEPKQKKLSEF